MIVSSSNNEGVITRKSCFPPNFHASAASRNQRATPPMSGNQTRIPKARNAAAVANKSPVINGLPASGASECDQPSQPATLQTRLTGELVAPNHKSRRKRAKRHPNSIKRAAPQMPDPHHTPRWGQALAALAVGWAWLWIRSYLISHGKREGDSAAGPANAAVKLRISREFSQVNGRLSLKPRNCLSKRLAKHSYGRLGSRGQAASRARPMKAQGGCLDHAALISCVRTTRWRAVRAISMSGGMTRPRDECAQIGAAFTAARRSFGWSRLCDAQATPRKQSGIRLPQSNN